MKSLVGMALAWVAAAVPALAQGVAASLVAAHRGGALVWPENSLLAFRSAVGLGADYVEFDVHLSRDGEVVVIHDPTLDRTTTGTGPVRERTLAELKTLRLRDRGGAVTEEQVPTLDEVAAIAAAGKRRMLLEIKVDAERRRYPGHRGEGRDHPRSSRDERVLGGHGLRARDVAARARASPRHHGRLPLFAGHAPGHGLDPVPGVEAAREAGVGVVGLHQALVDADTVAAVRRAGMTLGVWTVNDLDALRRVIDLGVAIVITDRPDLAKGLLGR